ncbi:hypothetical protein AY599_09290 [Leptolyngbya valderiana BDU 20041]|nr:hypothetical protein AY599_09290 [Leptolyngbya valderiana BDU 20041]
MTNLMINLLLMSAAAMFVWFSRRTSERDAEDRLARLALQASLLFLLISNLVLVGILVRLESYALLPGVLVVLAAVIYAGVVNLLRGPKKS